MTQPASPGLPAATGGWEGHRILLLALLEAVSSHSGGEVIVRGGRESGRVHVTNGRIAWVNVSTVHETFGERLTQSGLLSVTDLQAVLDECRRTGANFAELAVSWGLVPAEAMRAIFFEHTVQCMAETFRLPDIQAIFAPVARSYSGTLLFTLEEVLDEISRRGIVLSGFAGKRREEESVRDFLDRMELESLVSDLNPAALLPLDVEILASVPGIVAASVTNGAGRSGFVGSMEGVSAQDVTPPLDLILAAANQATARSGLGNVIGLWISSPQGVAVVQEFSGGKGLVRCVFAPGSNPALVRIQLEKILSRQDER